MKVDLYHNIRWSRYKAGVFSALHRLADAEGEEVRFFQVADTSGERITLSAVDQSWHRYPHVTLFPGSYDAIPRLKLVSTLFRRVYKSNADIVLIQGFDRLEHWAMLLAAVMTRKARATFCDSTLLDRKQSPLKGFFKRVFFSRCNGVFCYGERARQYLRHYGVPDQLIFQRYQAAALPAAYEAAAVVANRLKYVPPPERPRFLYVGRLSEEKGLDTLLQAFVETRNAVPGARLVFAGGGPLAQSLRAEVDRIGLGEAVEFTGGLTQEALAEQYVRATCLVLPSRSEAWGLVVNEALHYGCPVIVSERCGCVPELVKDGSTGYSFRADNPDDLARKLQILLSTFTSTGQVAQRCLEAIEPFSPKVAAKQILQGCRVMLAAEGRP